MSGLHFKKDLIWMKTSWKIFHIPGFWKIKQPGKFQTSESTYVYLCLCAAYVERVRFYRATDDSKACIWTKWKIVAFRDVEVALISILATIGTFLWEVPEGIWLWSPLFFYWILNLCGRSTRKRGPI